MGNTETKTNKLIEEIERKTFKPYCVWDNYIANNYGNFEKKIKMKSKLEMNNAFKERARKEREKRNAEKFNAPEATPVKEEIDGPEIEGETEKPILPENLKYTFDY